jgi:hypothetical protein
MAWMAAQKLDAFASSFSKARTGAQSVPFGAAML